MTVIAPATTSGLWLWASILFTVMAMGAAPMLTWAGRHPVTARLVTGVLIASGLGVGVRLLAVACCSGCDPFWAIFYLCI